jgi:hypothetical protein
MAAGAGNQIAGDREDSGPFLSVRQEGEILPGDPGAVRYGILPKPQSIGM